MNLLNNGWKEMMLQYFFKIEKFGWKVESVGGRCGNASYY
jgi:hypothetical protein